MKKRDIILAGAVIAAALVMYILIRVFSSESGNEAMIRLDGEIYGTYDLNEDQTIEVVTDAGRNVVRIENGEAFMEEADCPDGYCKNQGKISHLNETIVCLPHKLVVEVVSEADASDDVSDGGFDAISQ